MQAKNLSFSKYYGLKKFYHVITYLAAPQALPPYRVSYSTLRAWLDAYVFIEIKISVYLAISKTDILNCALFHAFRAVNQTSTVKIKRYFILLALFDALHILQICKLISLALLDANPVFPISESTYIRHIVIINSAIFNASSLFEILQVF